MDTARIKRTLTLAGVFVGVWLVFQYLFPIFLPFLLGLVLALLAEPGVKFLQKKLHFSRSSGTFLSVSVTLFMFLSLLTMAAGVLVRQAGALAGALPGALEQLTGQTERLRSWVVDLTHKAPDSLSQPLEQAVEELFTSGSVLLERGTDAVLGVAGQAAQVLPGGLLLAGTAVISGYLISARLPRLREGLTVSRSWQQRWRPALLRLRDAAILWLRAQVKLSAVTFVIVLAGFLILRIGHPVRTALLTALVDAVPLLGTGIVLLPWSLYSLLEGETARSIGLLGIYVAAMVTRSGLEPRLLARQLKLDPLVTLVALYAGYRIWGFGGMVLAPILTVTARELAKGD